MFFFQNYVPQCHNFDCSINRRKISYMITTMDNKLNNDKKNAT